jgi:hypothetical protein
MNNLPSGWRFRTNWRGQMILQRRERVGLGFLLYD